MDNDLTMEMSGETKQKKSKLPLVGIIAGVLLLVAVIAISVMNSPKVLMGALVRNTPDSAVNFFNAEKADKPLFMTESHKSETKISMSGEDLGMDGDIKLELSSGYQNSTGDFAAEIDLGLGDLDAITAGIFLSKSEAAIISSLLSDKYVIDLEKDELGDNTTFEDRIMMLIMSGDDEELNDLTDRLEKEIQDIQKFSLKMLPNKSINKGKENIEIFGEDKKMAYVEIALDKDEFEDWVEAVFEMISEDKEFEELIVEIAEYIDAEYNFEDEINPDDVDLEEFCENAINDLDDLEAEVSLRIYRKGFTPIAYEVNYEDEYSEADMVVLMYNAGNKTQLLLDGEVDGDEIYYNVYADGDTYSLIEYEFDEMKYEVTVEKVKDIYEIDGSFDYGYMGKGKISGEIEESNNETIFDMKVEMEDSYGSENEVEYEGSLVKDGAVTKTELSMKTVIDGEDVARVEWESETEEVKKNKEYSTEGKIKITDIYSDIKYVIDVDNSVLFGDEVEVDLPNWSKDDVYAKVSDDEALEELFDSLSMDFETGFADFFSLLYYGGLY